MLGVFKAQLVSDLADGFTGIKYRLCPVLPVSFFNFHNNNSGIKGFRNSIGIGSISSFSCFRKRTVIVSKANKIYPVYIM